MSHCVWQMVHSVPEQVTEYEMSHSQWQIVHWLIKVRTIKIQVRKRLRRILNRLAKVHPEFQLLEILRQRFHWLIELVTKLQNPNVPREFFHQVLESISKH